MPDKQQIVLSEEALIDIEALSAKVPDGPWFAAPDEAEDVPDHRRSGLALVDTGRSADWWIARLCEWHIANFIAASKTNVDALCQTVRALRAENEKLKASRRVHELDNHHNALACGYCSAPLKNELTRLASIEPETMTLRERLSELQKERDALRERLAEEVARRVNHDVERMGRSSKVSAAEPEKL